MQQMTKVRYLKLRFSNRMKPFETVYFRAAVIEASRRQSILFHNHYQDGGYRYAYPLIQYKVTQKKATIVCLHEGTDDIHYFLQNRDLRLQIGNRAETFEIEDIHLKYFPLGIVDERIHYALRHWLALNQENYARYQQLDTEIERLQMLQRLLTSQFLALAKGIDWQVPHTIEVDILKLKEVRTVSYKDQKLLAFSLNFRCNVSLPNYIGLGKGASVGFGMVKRLGGGGRYVE